jgi:hypothetical protein
MSRHGTDFFSLAFGLLFAAIGLVLLTGQDGALSMSWVAPATAIVVGGLIILAARSSRPPAADSSPEE